MKQSVTRLYEIFKPEKYILELSLDPAGKKFSGTVSIRGQKTGRPSKRLTFHSKGLKVTSAIVHKVNTKSSNTDGTKIKIDRINLQKSFDEVRLHAKETLYPGEYFIVLEFSGLITDPMNGLYPCYFHHEGKDKFLLATQFESHHAREVFPCIDEPEAKATFDLALSTPKDGEVIANTPARSTIDEGETKITVFETTPVMSTYLLAFAYGDMKAKEAKTKSGTLVRTFATPDNIQFTDFALETAVKCLEFYEEYFGIAYPLAKCDMLALPDFASGAMENWGLITYREQTLLVDPKNTSLQVKQFVAMVVAHELAHQWFGNLVTMRWWTDLWLNEGFASWIEYLAVDKLFPDWEMWTQFIVDEQQSALKLDALDNTHPIEVPIGHPDEIRSIFDTISYSKGASVIHMLQGYLGADVFRDGLRHYLKSNAYKNTETVDLWQALEDASKKPVKDFMHAWTSTAGFPLVSFVHEDKKVSLTQSRFYSVKPEKPASTLWPIPLLSGKGAPDQLNSESLSYENKDISKLNQGQSGFYRVFYDEETTLKFTSSLDSLSPLDRLGLLSDSFEAAKAGYMPVVRALELLSAYKDEANAAVWDIIAANISELRRAMDDDKLREIIKPYILKITAKELKRLGWQEKPDENHFDRLLRPTILGLCSSADEKSVIKECRRLFKEAKSSEDLPVDLRGVIYSTVARNGAEPEFDKLLKLYRQTSNSEEKLSLASALTNFKQPKFHKEVLGLIKTPDVRRQDALYWLAFSFGNHYSRDVAWQWMVSNWAWLEKVLGHDLSFFRSPIYAARSFTSDEFLKQYLEFFKAHDQPALTRSIKQGEELLTWQIAYKKRELKNVLDFFSKN